MGNQGIACPGELFAEEAIYRARKRLGALPRAGERGAESGEFLAKNLEFF